MKTIITEKEEYTLIGLAIKANINSLLCRLNIEVSKTESE
jgi:hypothetical protein